MNYTDANVPIQCSNCPGEHFEEGKGAILLHIIAEHSDFYSSEEAEEYAQLWTEDAHRKIEDSERAITEAFARRAL